MFRPIEIKRIDAKGLRVTWSDNSIHQIGSENLRRKCPCAECRELRGDSQHAAPLSPNKKSALNIVQSTLEIETELLEVWAVGQYGIGLKWGDGHNTGIYTFDYLYEIGEAELKLATPTTSE